MRPNDKVADFINDFFSNIGPSLAKGYNEPWKFFGEVCEDKCPVFVTDYEQVAKLCSEIQLAKSSGMPDIATKVFKDSFKVIIPQMVYMFNLSFETGIFPNSWKKATVIPLYKGGPKTEVSNYRPVSLLPLPGKLLEKIAHARMSAFFELNGIISDKQGGFRKGYSTMSTVAELTDCLLSNTNKDLVSLAAFVDLRKAFDTVDHTILKRKLRCYGIADIKLEWCSNYLSDRTQLTYANGVASGSKEVMCGVPQGSVLGPLFFILYVNDVQHAVKGSQLQLYADDTVIHTAGKGVDKAVAKLQPSLNQFSKWCRCNKLTLNAAKTKLMIFGTRPVVKKNKDVVIKIGGVPLQVVPTYKYLGITLDSTLTFNYYTKTVCNVVAYKTNLLAKIRKYLTEDVALKVYKSMILPYFDYGDIIYNTASQELRDKLQRLQNRCLKICKRVNTRFNTKDLHSITNMPMLHVRREARQIKHHHVDKRNIRTRAHDAPLFMVKVPRVEAYKRSIEYAGALQWNNLPPATRKIKDLDVFKVNQKAMMEASIVR